LLTILSVVFYFFSCLGLFRFRSQVVWTSKPEAESPAVGARACAGLKQAASGRVQRLAITLPTRLTFGRRTAEADFAGDKTFRQAARVASIGVRSASRAVRWTSMIHPMLKLRSLIGGSSIRSIPVKFDSGVVTEHN
jgi:hypothetical protein